MNRKKIRTDNVEQLLEVVKAVQRGEDPEKAVEEIRAESEAAAEAQRIRFGRRKSGGRTAAGDGSESAETDSESRDAQRSSIRADRKNSRIKGRDSTGAEQPGRRAGSQDGSEVRGSRTEAGDSADAEQPGRRAGSQDGSEVRGSRAEGRGGGDAEQPGRSVGDRAEGRGGESGEQPDRDSDGRDTAGNGRNKSDGRRKSAGKDSRGSGSRLVESWDDGEPDEFEQLLNEEDEQLADFMPALTEKVRALANRILKSGTKTAKHGKSSGSTEAESGKKLVGGAETESGKKLVGGAEAESGQKPVADAESKQEPESDFRQGHDAAGIRENNGPKTVHTGTGETEPAVLENMAFVQPEKEESENAEPENQESAGEKTEDEIIIDRLLERDDIQEEDGAADGEEPSSNGRSKHSFFLNGVRSYLSDLMGNLKERGISRRELLMIVLGIILAALVVTFVVNGVRSAFARQRKSQNVTADEGLTVTVEDEPEEWCSSYPVQLWVHAKSRQITEITVNDEVYEPDADGVITVATGEYLLAVKAVTEEGTLEAQVEIPMLDSQAPAVSLENDGGMIVAAAADARSGVEKICYAVVYENDYLQLPVYQEYSEPLLYEEGAVYSFYAEDAAGNRSTPVETTMAAVESITIAQESLLLEPGEVYELEVRAEPEGAFLNNLRFESANTNVVTVDSKGRVTAVQEGSTIISVSADGADKVSCAVNVSSERTVTISAIGDCTLGTDAYFNTSTNFDAFASVYGTSYFFENVREVLENDDVTFANFEGTLTTETTRADKEYAFRGDPSYTDILIDGSIDVVTLANNHSSDYGEQSLADTKSYLTEAGIDYCMGDTIVTKEINGVKTAFIGIYVLQDGTGRETQVRNTIAQAQDEGAQLIIVGFHWGEEKATQPDSTQTYLAHLAVDCGADLVVGHHPHVLQGIEKYNGVYIVYSLGNFCFGGNSNPSSLDSIIFRQTFTISSGVVQEDDEIEIIPCLISSADGYNNFQPTVAEGTDAERIISTINEYSAEFGQTYGL